MSARSSRGPATTRHLAAFALAGAVAVGAGPAPIVAAAVVATTAVIAALAWRAHRRPVVRSARTRRSPTFQRAQALVGPHG